MRGLDGLWGMYQWLDRAPQRAQRDGRLVAPPRRVRPALSQVVGVVGATRGRLEPRRGVEPSVHQAGARSRHQFLRHGEPPFARQQRGDSRACDQGFRPSRRDRHRNQGLWPNAAGTQWRRPVEGDHGRCRRRRGTEGSNPSLSSSESTANPTSSGADDPESFGLQGHGAARSPASAMSDAGDPVGAETGGGRPTTSLNAARHGIAPRSGRSIFTSSLRLMGGCG
jgi:hypothetical protein